MNKSLLPLNATSSECALEQVTERASDLPVPIQTLWDPQTCPENLLPWLAWALSVDAWDSDWPTFVKRKVIAESVVIHRRKGTVEAVRRAMAVLGVQVELREWFETDGPPHTFSVTAWASDNFREDDAPLLTADYYRSLKRAVDTAKPVRSHYDFKVGARFGAGLGLAAVAQTTARTREAGEAHYPGARLAGAVHLGAFQRLYTVFRVAMESV